MGVELGLGGGGGGGAAGRIGDPWATSLNIVGQPLGLVAAGSVWLANPDLPDGVRIETQSGASGVNQYSGVVMDGGAPQGVIGLQFRITVQDTDASEGIVYDDVFIPWNWGPLEDQAEANERIYQVHNQTTRNCELHLTVGSRPSPGETQNWDSDQLGEQGWFVGTRSVGNDNNGATGRHEYHSVVLTIHPVYAGSARDGVDGHGSYERTLFRNASSTPDVPTTPNSIDNVGNIPGIPENWSADPTTPDDSTENTYAVIQRVTLNSLVVTYSTVARWSGRPGTNGNDDGGGGISGIRVQDEGSDLTSLATTLNFTGAGVEATGSTGVKTINIPGGGEDGGRGQTNLSIGDRTSTTLEIDSDTGTDAIVPAATDSLAGLMTGTEHQKLGNIETGATRDQTGDEIITLLEAETDDDRLAYSAIKDVPTATVDEQGIIQIASIAEEDVGETDNKASTPAGVHHVVGPVVTTDEKTAGTATTVRRYSPADIFDMVANHGTGLNQNQVDARVAALVEAAALLANTSTRFIKAKLPNDVVYTAVLNAAIVGFQTASDVTTAINNALAALDAVDNQGDWAAGTAYVQNDLTRHDGAWYIARRDVAANSQATTEPGSGSDWETYWYRIGYENGLPSAVTGASVDGQTLTLARNSGLNPIEITLPSRGGSSEAVSTRAERITFQTIAATSSDVEATPIETDPISVVLGEGDPEILLSVSGNDVTVAANIYIVDINFVGRQSPRHSEAQFKIRQASDDTVLDTSTSVNFENNITPELSAKLVLLLDENTPVNLLFNPVAENPGISGTWTATFVRLGGGKEIRTIQSFNPSELGRHSFDLTGDAASIETGLTCPASGWIWSVVSAPTVGLVGDVKQMLAADLREADADSSLTAGLYTDGDNQIILQVASQMAAQSGNEIIIFHAGTTTDDSGGSTPVTPDPSILRFTITGDQAPAAGNIGGTSYAYDVAISQGKYVSSARIVGYPGAPSVNPTSVSVLQAISDVHDETGSFTLPDPTNIAADGQYTIELQVFKTGQTVGTDTPIAEHDWVIRARAAATALVHFGAVVGADNAAARAAIVFANDDLATSATAAGDYNVTGLPDDGQFYRLYLAVPTSLTQPTSFIASGQYDITSSFDSADRTIGGVSYTIYVSEDDYDNTSNLPITVS